MAVDQSLLLYASAGYKKYANREFYPSHSLRAQPKRRIYVCHALEDFRLVEGFITLMRAAGIDAYYDWKSGMNTSYGSEQAHRGVKERVALSNIFIFLATENSLSNEDCLKELTYANLVRRTIYIASTTEKNKEYGNNFIGKYHQLTIERSMQQAGAILVKVLESHRQHLWRIVPSISQL